MPVGAITIETMRTAFAQYAETHEAGVDSPVLVDLEPVVHLLVHRGS